MQCRRTSILVIAALMLLFQAASVQAQTKTKQSKKSTATESTVDLNTATEKELDTLPGVGPATAKKIIAARPYSSVNDLAKSGIPAATIKKITPLVTVSGSAASTNAGSQPQKTATPSQEPSRKRSAPSSQADTGNPGPGMVWVNLDSRVYHYQGSRYYGKTKNGKYMSETDAVAAGYRAAKNEKKPQAP